jgi:hypothetical protein
MNSFGRLFRVNVFGESHGASVGVNIDGIPAGIPLTQEDFLPDLERRKAGAKGTTPRKERICLTSSPVYSTTILPVPPSQYYLKTIIPVAPITRNYVSFPVPVMRIL